jgi:hypothetical protein
VKRRYQEDRPQESWRKHEPQRDQREHARKRDSAVILEPRNPTLLVVLADHHLGHSLPQIREHVYFRHHRCLTLNSE